MLKNNVTLGEFQPIRLSQARKAMKWNQTGLAEKIGVTRQAFSIYEKDNNKPPSQESLLKLSKELNVPGQFFFTPLRESELKLESAINYRKLTSKTKKARDQAEVYMQWTASLADFVSDKIQRPKVNVPDFSLDYFVDYPLEDIEDLASEVRRYYKLGDGPISNLTMLLENNGALVSRVGLEAGMEGVSAWYNSMPIMLINRKAYHSRSRLDLAHEFLHIICHRHATSDDLDDSHTLKCLEKQAFRFAGAFLAPAKSFLPEVYSTEPEALVELKKRWGISVSAIITRLKDLGVLSDYKATGLRIETSQWRRKEPLDGEIHPEEPALFEKIRDFLNEKSVFSGNEFEVASRLPEYHIRFFMNKLEHEKPQLSNVLAFPEKKQA